MHWAGRSPHQTPADVAAGTGAARDIEAGMGMRLHVMVGSGIGMIHLIV